MRTGVLKQLGFTGLVFLSALPGLAATEWLWQAKPEVWIDGEFGPVPAVQAQTGNEPLILGIPEGAFQPRYAPTFQPADGEESAVYRFSGSNFAFVPNFWKNPDSFSGQMIGTVGSVSSAQTLLLVAGVFDLRLEPSGGGVELVLYVYSGSRAVAARVGSLNTGEGFKVSFSLDGDGSISLRLSEGDEGSSFLPGSLDQWNTYPELFVGSANPNRYARPFTGAIHAIRIVQSDSAR